MEHILQSHIPTTKRTTKYDYNTPSEGACGEFKYERNYTTTSLCAFKACTATNLTDFSYEMFCKICRSVQTYSESWLKGWSPAKQEIAQIPCSLGCPGHEGDRVNRVQNNTVQTCSVLFYANYSSDSDFCERKVRGRKVKKTQWPYNTLHI